MKLHLWPIIASLILSAALASGTAASVGKVIIAKGDTFAVDANNATRSLKRRSEIHEGDTLVTGANSEIHIRFQDNAVLALRADSKLVINEYHAADDTREEKVLMELLSGGFRTITGAFGKTDKDAYQIRTPNASIGIRGTNYEALLSNNDLIVGVYQGGVQLQNPTGSIDLGADSAFSFAQVSGPRGGIEGLVEPPAELKQPLATSFNAPATPGEERGDDNADEAAAELTNDDENLLVENLFENNEENNQPARPPARPILNTLASVLPADATKEDIKALAEEFDLTDLQDVRLTQAQLRELLDGPDVGFVVVGDNTDGYRLPVYTSPNTFGPGLSAFSTGGSNLTFDLSLQSGDKTYTITIDLTSNCVISCDLVAEINNQIQNDVGSINGTPVPPPILVSTAGGKVVFTGYSSTDGGAQIVLDNFSGDTVALEDSLADELGFCATPGNCPETFNMGMPSDGGYNTAAHFGYVVAGQNGPVFVNYESESIYALNGEYITPDNVFRGNGNAQLVNFDAVDLGQGNTVQWGYWNTSAINPAVLLKDQSSLAVNEQIGAPFFFVKVLPAKQAAMQGVKTLNVVADWHATSSTSSGMHSLSGSGDLSASLSVDFATSQATGNLNFSNSPENWNWSMQYYGEVKNAQFFSDYGFGSLNYDSTVYDAVGLVDGLFTDVTTGLGFVGGFGLQTTDDAHSAQGVFIITE